MNKYFSYDPFEGDINYHNSEKEAKAEALKLAEDYYDDCREWDGSFDETSIDQIKRICYGLALGNIDLPTRPVNDDDDESSKENFSYIVEHPVIVELEKSNKWIKCSERLPETFTGLDLLIQSVPCLVYGLYAKDSKKPGIFGARLFGDKWHSVDGECYEVTHWMPFPKPPED